MNSNAILIQIDKNLPRIHKNKDFARFLEIAIGSCYEMETQIILSNDLGFIDEKTCKLVLADLETIIKMTSKFKSTLK